MRLLRTNLKDGLRLESFDDIRLTPKYAILSHTWDKEEVLFEHISAQKAKRQKGYKKIEGCCNRAKQDGFEYIWVDTCCINKASSAELSEAINSMFAWYRNAQICYAHLQDVPNAVSPELPNSFFRVSRWFTRGWTLQELIAPRRVEFFTAEWTFIGERTALAPLIEKITGVDYAVLCGLPVEVSVAKRMSWAARRQTTRVEDRAYSLMGLFGLHMQAIYGEGERAFWRLQQELLSQSMDYSIFAWESDDPAPQGLLASSPEQFANCANIIETPYAQFVTAWKLPDPVPEMQRSGLGLRLRLPLFEVPDSQYLRIAALPCKNLNASSSGSPYYTVGLLLRAPEHPTECWTRLTRHISLSERVSLLDVDCLTSFRAPWEFQQIYAAMRIAAEQLVVGRLERFKPRGMNVTMKAITLYRLREQYGLVFSRVKANREWEHAQNTPLEMHIRTTVSGGNGEEDLCIAVDILRHEANFTFTIDFGNAYSRLSIHTQVGLLSKFDVRTLVDYAEKPFTAPTSLQATVVAGSTPLQSVNWINEQFQKGPEVNLIMVRTGIDSGNVCSYVLDVKLQGVKRTRTLSSGRAEWVRLLLHIMRVAMKLTFSRFLA